MDYNVYKSITQSVQRYSKITDYGFQELAQLLWLYNHRQHENFYFIGRITNLSSIWVELMLYFCTPEDPSKKQTEMRYGVINVK